MKRSELIERRRKKRYRAQNESSNEGIITKIKMQFLDEREAIEQEEKQMSEAISETERALQQEQRASYIESSQRIFQERQEGCCHNRAVPQQKQRPMISKMHRSQIEKQLLSFWKISEQDNGKKVDQF